MKRAILFIIALLPAFADVCAQQMTTENAETVVSRSGDWSLVAGGSFDMYFDNREYADCAFAESQTMFSSRLTPYVGIGWGGESRNRLMFGMDLRSDFGDATKVFAEVRPLAWYRFATRNVSAYAGIFPREEMIGHYGEAILGDSMRFYDNRIQGVMGQYRGSRGYAELSVDWCGMYSEASREKFRILSAGRIYFDRQSRFYGGYAFSMLHFAGSKLIEKCVVDNLTLNPYIGARFNAWLDFDINLHYIQTFQHDRDNEPSYRKPLGGMLGIRLSKWGIFLDEQLYVGDDLQPFRTSPRSERFPNGYGGELYAGDSFFNTAKHIYSNFRFGYDRWFFDNTLRVHCYMALQYDGTGWGNKQMVSVSVRLLKDIPLGRRNRE